MDGFYGKSLKIDDNWGYPHDLGNLHFNNRCGPWKLIFPQLIVNLIHNLKISFQDALWMVLILHEYYRYNH